LAEEVQLDEESSRILVQRVVEALQRHKQRESEKERESQQTNTPSHIKEAAKEITEAVRQGLDDGSITEGEVLAEYYRQLKRTVDKEDKQAQATP
jgi:DNA-binding IscR family transcriptional regulator